MLGRKSLRTWIRTSGLVLLPVLAFGGCASAGGGGAEGGSDLRGQPPRVAGQSFAFTGQAHAQGRNSDVLEGEVHFLDDEWYIMERDGKPCHTLPRRYRPVADELSVGGCDVSLTFYLVEGRIAARIAGPVTVRGEERVCDYMENVDTTVRCARWSTVTTEREIRGEGEAEITRITGGG